MILSVMQIDFLYQTEKPLGKVSQAKPGLIFPIFVKSWAMLLQEYILYDTHGSTGCNTMI